jgi:hypothetical protein
MSVNDTVTTSLCQRGATVPVSIQTCTTMKVLFGMALRQTTGFVDRLLRLIGPD